MAAVRISRDMWMVIVGSPIYFAKRSPRKPTQNLIDHICVNLRLPTLGKLYA
jgi:hypothetical protein